nr:hypothetical protein B0A51_15998 [Rachicladosporium sp. CCFEE 5018]
MQTSHFQANADTDRKAEIEYRARRRSTQTPASRPFQVYSQLPRLFSMGGRSSETESDCDTTSDDTSSSNFLAREPNNSHASYSRLMLAHTKTMMKVGTIPGYAKTMHQFTQNQMNLCGDSRSSRSEASSPHAGAATAVVPQRLISEMTRLRLDEGPSGPANTPTLPQRPSEISLLAAGTQRSRSLTEPVPRDFATSSIKDFALIQ